MSFISILNFLQTQTRRLFLQRYLKRDEVLGQIRLCDTSLADALGLFGIFIPIPILRQMQDTERARQKDETHPQFYQPAVYNARKLWVFW